MLTNEKTKTSEKSLEKTFISSDAKNKKGLTKETQLFFKALQKN